MPVRTTEVIETASARRWFRATMREDEVGIEAGVVGNRLDPARRALRAAWSVRPARDRVVVLSVWPTTADVTDVPGRWAAEVVGLVEAADGAPADIDAVVGAAGALVPSCRWGTEPATHVARLTGLIHPLLRPCLDVGAVPPPVIPAAVLPLVRQHTPRSAARRLTSRVTRPLIRAVADALLPDDEGIIRWDRLLAAAIAAPTCGPEQLTAILRCVPAEPGRFTVDLVDLRRATGRTAGRAGRAVAEELLTHLERPGGADDYLRAVRAWDPRPPRRVPVHQPPAERPRAPAPAPVDRRPAPPVGRLRYPASIAALDGTELLPGLTIALPVDTQMLVDWGNRLANCLALYRELAARGATTIIGLQTNGRLLYALEVSPTGVLHQFESAANGRPRADRRAAIVAELRRRGIVEVDAAR